MHTKFIEYFILHFDRDDRKCKNKFYDARCCFASLFKKFWALLTAPENSKENKNIKILHLNELNYKNILLLMEHKKIEYDMEFNLVKESKMEHDFSN